MSISDENVDENTQRKRKAKNRMTKTESTDELNMSMTPSAIWFFIFFLPFTSLSLSVCVCKCKLSRESAIIYANGQSTRRTSISLLIFRFGFCFRKDMYSLQQQQQIRWSDNVHLNACLCDTRKWWFIIESNNGRDEVKRNMRIINSSRNFRQLSLSLFFHLRVRGRAHVWARVNANLSKTGWSFSFLF